MQGTQVRSLDWEDSTGTGATKAGGHNHWACALGPVSHNYWSLHTLEHTRLNYWAHVLQLLSLHAATTEAAASKVSAPQKEKPLQWEAQAHQWGIASDRCN